MPLVAGAFAPAVVRNSLGTATSLQGTIPVCVQCPFTTMVVQMRRSASSASVGESPGAPLASPLKALSEDLTPYAKALPKLKRTGDAHTDNEGDMRRRSLMKTISRLQENPAVVLQVEQYVMKLLDPDTKTAAAQDDKWDRTVVSTMRLPKYWCAKWLAQNDTSTGTKLSQPILDLMDSKDTKNIKRLFNMVTMTLPTTPLPHKARDSKLLCSQLWTARLRELDDFLRGWCQKAVDPTTGIVNWTKGGAYTFHFNEAGVIETVEFLNGDRATVDVHMTNAFSVRDPWDAWGAVACQGAVKEYVLHRFFLETNTGPYKYLLDKKGIHLTQLAERLHDENELAEQRKERAMVSEADSFIGETRRQLRSDALKAAQAKAKAASKRRRIVSASDCTRTT